jgi:hypothetical protein
MLDTQRQELSSEMREHERQIAELTRMLALIQRQPMARGHHEFIFLTAKVMKHRISMALLASRLGEAMPLQ